MLSSLSSTVYSFWTSLLESFFQTLGLKGKEGTLLLLGLDNAGKTTLLHRLRTGGSIRNYPPTERPSLTEKFSFQGVSFQAWDLGGHEAVRHLWGDYVCECKALLFLIDSADDDRLEEAGYELDALIAEGAVTNVPIAILLNKCDLPQAMQSRHICDKIQFDDLARMHGEERLRTFRISVLRGEGYQDAFRWVSGFL